MDERVGLLGEEPLVGVDAAPADRDRERSRRLAGADVERRVADVDGLARAGSEAAQRLEHRIRVGLVPLGVLGADEHVGQLARGAGSGRTRARTVATRFGGHDPELVAAAAQLGQQLEDAVEGLERRVERLVVGAVDVDELVDAVGIEVAHLRDQARAADRGADALLVRLAAEHGHGGMSHRGEDDRPRVDQGAVEVEEDDAVPHDRDRSRRRDSSASAALRILDPLEIEPPGGAVAPPSDRGRPSSSCANRSGSTCSIVPTSVRTMWRRNESAVTVKWRWSPRRSHAAVADDRGRKTSCWLSAGVKAREVVLAGKERGARLERLEVDRPRPPERAPRLERRPRGAVQHEVAVRARRGREAGVEPVGGILARRGPTRRPAAPC